MKTRIITLLLGLMAAISLLTVTAWAEDAPELSKHKAQELIGSITLRCKDHQSVLNFPEIARYTDFSLEWDSTKSNDSVYVGTLTVNAVPFVDYWNLQTNDDPHHIITGNNTYTFGITYTVADEEKWSLKDADGNPVTNSPGVTFQVSCEKPTLPDAELLAQSKVFICVANTPTYLPYNPRGNWYDANISDNSISWDNNIHTWRCRIPVDVDAILKQYAQDNGGSFVAPPDFYIWLKYDMNSNQWTPWYGDEPAADIYAIPAPTPDDLKRLDITANISCKDGSHAVKSFALTSFSQLSGSWVYNETSDQYEYHLTLTNAAAKDFVAQYDVVVEKTHSLDNITGQVTLIWDRGEPDISSLDGGIAVYANTEEHWALVGNAKAFNITAVCVNETPRDTSHTRRYPAVTAPAQAAEPTVSSAKTFDGGVALYAGLSLLSVTGSAALLHKRKNV